jgi:hypothetical protein
MRPHCWLPLAARQWVERCLKTDEGASSRHQLTALCRSRRAVELPMRLSGLGGHCCGWFCVSMSVQVRLFAARGPVPWVRDCCRLCAVQLARVQYCRY